MVGVDERNCLRQRSRFLNTIFVTSTPNNLIAGENVAKSLIITRTPSLTFNYGNPP